MSDDASLPPNAPMINGLYPADGHGEVDASSSSLAEICADLYSRVSAFLSAPPKSDLMRRTQEQARVSLSVIEKALREYDFDSLSLSYNGGKDCLVLLILYLATIHTHFISPPTSTSKALQPFPTSIPSIYARPPDPFPAVTAFVATSSSAYHLDLAHIATNPYPSNPTTSNPRITFRDAFSTYLSNNPSIRAIFVGTRRTDPHGTHLTHFDRTDHGWPDFMRIHPVIDWKLSEIWCFLRAGELCESAGQNLQYCDMYDAGYTSLGGVGDTLRNPKLKYLDNDGRERYKPAYELTEDDEERLGRE